jgi:hypothetical protein
LPARTAQRLSERLAELLASHRDDENMHVVMTAGAVDELISLIEAAEAVVELQRPDSFVRLGFDAEYHRQLDAAIHRLKGVLGG